MAREAGAKTPGYDVLYAAQCTDSRHCPAALSFVSTPASYVAAEALNTVVGAAIHSYGRHASPCTAGHRREALELLVDRCVWFALDTLFILWPLCLTSTLAHDANACSHLCCCNDGQQQPSDRIEAAAVMLLLWQIDPVALTIAALLENELGDSQPRLG